MFGKSITFFYSVVILRFLWMSFYLRFKLVTFYVVKCLPLRHVEMRQSTGKPNQYYLRLHSKHPVFFQSTRNL